MARKQRIHYPGALYHVILRGNAGQEVFFEDGDRYRFYLLLQEGAEKYGCRIHAFCLMTNHIHLAIQAGEIPLSRIMHNISFRYTSWINRRMKRTGHLFQGRYKAILVDADSYLLELVTYLHLNPVRAGMVTDPGEHPWSSHRAYLGNEALPWLTTDDTLAMFSQNRSRAVKLYSRYIGDRIRDGHNDRFHKGEIDSRLMGEDRFVEEALNRARLRMEMKPGISEIVAIVKSISGIGEEALGSRQRGREVTGARTLTAWAVSEFSDATISEVGRMFGRDVSTLSACVKRMTGKARTDPKVAAMMIEVRAALENNTTKQA
jgi:REP element-mobilizing transposase RayT